MNQDVPHDRLMFFKEQLGFDRGVRQTLQEHSALFAAHSREFADYFETFFSGLEQTRPYLEVQDYPGQLQNIWQKWFSELFVREVDSLFLEAMWKSGIAHVRINLDHRYVNLSYCLARRFCRGIIREHIPAGKQPEAYEAVEKILDLCLLIETDAFITSTFQCDSEVIKGIAHQIRNPLTVIGGSIMRLKRREDVSLKALEITYETILAESRRMERMVADVSAYNEVFHKSSRWTLVPLHEQLTKALEACRKRFPVKDLELQTGFARRDMEVLGSPGELYLLFYHLLENAFEAVDPVHPVISLQTSPDPGTPRFALVEIFNTGRLADSINPEVLFTPFYSSKAMGTGMGLPIARAAVQKIKGRVSLYPAPGGGVVCMVVLPRSQRTTQISDI